MKYDWVHQMEGEKGLNKILILGNKCTGNNLIKMSQFEIPKEQFTAIQEVDYVLEPKILSLLEEGDLDEGERLETRVNKGMCMEGLEGLKEEINRMKKKKNSGGSISSFKGIDSDSTCQD